MPRPLVSIVIPCYNGAAFVGDAIESALRQTYPNREIIVIDDGSTDASIDVITSFGTSVHWRTGPNRGGSAARNIGLALARGEMVQFLDADDALVEAKLTGDVEQMARCEADVCVSRFRVVDGSSDKIAGPRQPPGQDVLGWVLSSDVRSMAPIYKADALRRIGGFTAGLPCCQEFDLNLRLAMAGAVFIYSPHVGYVVRRRLGSVSSDEVHLYRVMVSVLESLARGLRSTPHAVDRDLLALASKAAGCARWLLRLGDVQGGLAAVDAAQRIHPSGGVSGAYSLPARTLRGLLGPAKAEQVLWRLRSMTASQP